MAATMRPDCPGVFSPLLPGCRRRKPSRRITMKYASFYICLAASALLLLAACGTNQETGIKIEKSIPGIEGVWTDKEIETIGGPDEGKITDPQPSLLFITKHYYGTMFVSSAKPRSLFKTQTPTDKQIVEAYKNFITAGGPYELRGSTLILHTSVGLEPDAMSGGSLEFEYKLDGDTLTLTLDAAKIAYTTFKYKPQFTKGIYVLKRLE
jgi:hypothetical protein